MSQEEKKNKPGLKKPPVAFLICFTLATLGWIIINFSKDYTQTLEYKIVCTDLPEGTDTISTSDSILLITIKTKGFNYINPKFSDNNRVIPISIKEITAKKSKRKAYSFTKKEIREYIRKNEIIETDFIDIDKPETLTIYLKK